MAPLPRPSKLTLTALSGGVLYDLNDRTKLYLIAYDGLGLPASNRHRQRFPGQGGYTDLGQDTAGRVISLVWRLVSPYLGKHKPTREDFLAAFVPRSDDPILLTFGFPDGTKLAAFVNIEGTVDFSSADRRHRTEKAMVMLEAGDPRLFDPEGKTVSFTLSQAKGWTVPWPIESPTVGGWRIGESGLNLVTSILYANGSRIAAVEFPLIRLVGPLSSPVIFNDTTGEKLELTDNGGLVIPAGGIVDIDLSGGLRRDSKTIRDQDGNSLDQFLTTDSDLFTWHLAPAGEKLPDGSYADGTNIVRVASVSATTASRVDIIYFDRYQGA